MNHDCVTVAYPKITYDTGAADKILSREVLDDGGVQFNCLEAPFGILYKAGTPIAALPDYYKGADLPGQDRVWNGQTSTMLLRAPAPSASDFPAELQGEWCAASNSKSCFSLDEVLASTPNAFVSSISRSEVAPGAKDYSLCLVADLGPKECTTSETMVLRYFPADVAWDCAKAGKNGLLPGGLTSCKPDFSAAHDPSKPRLVILPNHQHDQQYVDSVPMYRVG